MIVFSNSKINLGLWVLNKRTDGYHNISTIFYPINWKDILEIIIDDSSSNQIIIKNYGLSLDIPVQQNIIYKAYQLLLEKFKKLPAVNVHLFKNVPFGAGLGAGSANATFFIKALNDLFKLNLSKEELNNLVVKLGSDCAFFLENKPVIAKEKGDKFQPISVNLNDYYILIIFPNINVSTAEAYKNIIPKMRSEKLEDIIQMPISEWKNYLENDFEKVVFKSYPLIAEIKNELYKQGAIYASMSGSGSAVYGFFSEKPKLNDFKNFQYFLNTPYLSS
ncbi:MAG TPA: 4-(cytidine 5'-diphospho)-2-C-methyl-D-erythritol kinase [Bacteroidia bacterium]|nr:4-(cytidine 5'-diphospho)-2-C-methyl-D-erythritol kinase [Bacteroidia bacterium]